MADHLPRTEDDRFPVPHRPPKKPKLLPMPPPMPKDAEPPIWPEVTAAIAMLVVSIIVIYWHFFIQTH